jgi:hypothetical protein
MQTARLVPVDSAAVPICTVTHRPTVSLSTCSSNLLRLDVRTEIAYTQSNHIRAFAGAHTARREGVKHLAFPILVQPMHDPSPYPDPCR